MTKPHPHAEFFRAIADGEPLSNWQIKDIDDTDVAKWMTPVGVVGKVFNHPELYSLRRKPTPKVIDWSKLGRHVPVRFHNNGKDCIGYMKGRSTKVDHSEPGPDSTSFYDGFFWWGHASLDTGLWVFNHDGVNPWPEGCVVQIRFESRSQGTFPASESHWGVGGADRIIASRFHSLEEGYSFGGES